MKDDGEPDTLAKHVTAAELVAIYRECARDIRRGCDLINGAEERMQEAFQGRDYTFSLRAKHNKSVEADADAIVGNLKREAWRVIVERLGIRQLLSIKRAEELNERLHKGELPDLTVEAIADMASFYQEHHGDMLQEAVEEVFNWLRPVNTRYKRNSQYEVPERVAITYMVSRWAGKFRVDCDRACRLMALDNLFSRLDGKGEIAKTYQGPSVDAIGAAPDGYSSTEYFEYRACKNRSLHITFRRPDLLARFNQLAGGKRLRAPEAA